MTTHYTEDHEWVAVEGDVASVGITVHAQDALGDVVFVELPEIGRAYAQKDAAGVVESVKAAADVYMPVSGEITEVNENLRADPSLANSDPMGAGWFFKLKLSRPAELAGLMDEAAYQKLIALVCHPSYGFDGFSPLPLAGEGQGRGGGIPRR
jgi:glycine cleavage system H protein